MNMENWLRQVITNQEKKAMPLLSYPATQLLFISVKDLVTNPKEMALGVRLIADRYNMPFATTYMDLSVEAEAFGANCVYHDNEIPTIIGQLIEDEDDLESLKVPELGDGRTGIVLDALKYSLMLVKDRPVFANCCGPFSCAGRLMDVNEILLLTYEEPELVHAVLGKVTEFLIKYIKAFKELGANGVIMAEPLAGLMSSGPMQEFSTDYVKRIVDEVQDKDFIICYHNCANAIEKKVEQVVNTGARMFHFGDKANMWELIHSLPQDCLVMGNISPAAIFKCDSSDKVAKDTQTLLRQCIECDNFIISSGCDVPADTPIENIDRFFEVVNIGYYKMKLWDLIS